jgi:hypothetical protein
MPHFHVEHSVDFPEKRFAHCPVIFVLQYQLLWIQVFLRVDLNEGQKDRNVEATTYFRTEAMNDISRFMAVNSFVYRTAYSDTWRNSLHIFL